MKAMTDEQAERSFFKGSMGLAMIGGSVLGRLPKTAIEVSAYFTALILLTLWYWAWPFIRLAREKKEK